jgi:ribosomal protein S28E/S33
MTGWYAELLDVKVAFLHGEFDEGTTIYRNDVILLLLKTIYGLKQAAYAF